MVRKEEEDPARELPFLSPQLPPDFCCGPLAENLEGHLTPTAPHCMCNGYGLSLVKSVCLALLSAWSALASGVSGLPGPWAVQSICPSPAFSDVSPHPAVGQGCCLVPGDVGKLSVLQGGKEPGRVPETPTAHWPRQAVGCDGWGN